MKMFGEKQYKRRKDNNQNRWHVYNVTDEQKVRRYNFHAN